MHLARIILAAACGATVVLGGTVLFMVIEDHAKPDPLRQLRLLVRYDRDTLAAFALMGAAGGVIALFASHYVVRRVRESRAKRLTLCRSCGYDLRASGDKCPECGDSDPRRTSAITASPPPIS